MGGIKASVGHLLCGRKIITNRKHLLKKTHKRDDGEENRNVLNWNIIGQVFKANRTSCWDSAIAYIAKTHIFG